MALPTVFVCGATGTQGGVVTRHLLAKGAKVHALVRTPTSPAAEAISKLGAKLFTGDWSDNEAITAAMEGCTGAFLNFSPDFADLSAELRYAKSILEIAKAAGVTSVVYSSGLSADAPERMRNFTKDSFLGHVLLSKQAIEKTTREAGIENWTVVRPGSFMANYLDPLVRMYGSFVEDGVWTTALAADSIMAEVDTETIGAFVCAAFLDPSRFHGQSIAIADEFLYPGQIIDKLAAATGRDLKVVHLTDKEIDEQKDTNPFVLAMFVARDLAQFVSLDEVKKWGIPLSTFDKFLEREKVRVHETYHASS